MFNFFNSSYSLSNALMVTFVSLGIILTLLLITWTALELYRFITGILKWQHSTQKNGPPISARTGDISATFGTGGIEGNDMIVAAVIAAIESATKT
ncbi:MAG: hypothetical protein LBL34_04745, partial [Clostridiales bacterium]|nr:hypothetical protein [Clostridiales bacterium]